MRRSSALMMTGALLAGSGVLATNAGYGPSYALGEFCDAIDGAYTPPFCNNGDFEDVGNTQIKLSTSLGRLLVMVDPNVEMDRTLDTAIAFSTTEIVKDISLPGIAFIDWQAKEKDGLIYVTQREDGEDVGIDASKLTFTPLAEESDLQDGVDDQLCPTPREDPDYTGCEMVVYEQNGWTSLPGIGADNQGEIWTRLMRIQELKIQDNRCTLQFVIAPIFQEVFGDTFDFSGEKGVSLTADAMTVGLTKIQMANALDVPVQQIAVKLSEEEYDLGPTYGERLDDEDNLGNLTDKDREDDWCLLDENQQQGTTVPTEKIRQIALAALAPEGYDVETGTIDTSDPELARLPDEILEKYDEEFGRV